MATTASYNGVNFSKVYVEDISQVIEFDEVGGKDPLFNRYSVTFRGIATLGDTSDCGVPLEKDDLGEGLDRITRLLGMPRRNFVLSIDDTTVFDVSPAWSELPSVAATTFKGMDLDNGPRPSPTIMQVIGSHSAKYRFSIAFAVPVCDNEDPTSVASGVINLSWTVADDIDGQSGNVTRLFRGQLRRRDRILNPHHYRHLVWPPLLDGFVRESVSFDDNGDQMALNFTIVDRQWLETPPRPATNWECIHRVSSPEIGGTRARNSMTIMLEAHRNVSQREMIEAAEDIADAKVNFTNTQESEKSTVITSLEIVSHLAKSNRIELHVETESYGTSATGIFNLASQTLGVPISAMGISGLGSYDGRTAENWFPEDTLTSILLANTIPPQNPCKPWEIPADVSSPTYVVPTLTAQQSNQTQVKNEPLPPYQTAYQQSHAYGGYLITSEIIYDTGQVALPVGVSSDAEDKTSNKIIQLYRPRVLRRLILNAERLNRQPEMPAPNESWLDKNGIRHTPVGKVKMVPSASQLSADGVFTINRVDFEIVYALDRAPTKDDAEGIPIGVVPYVTAGAEYVGINFKWPTATWIASGDDPETTPDGLEEIPGS